MLVCEEWDLNYITSFFVSYHMGVHEPSTQKFLTQYCVELKYKGRDKNTNHSLPSFWNTGPVFFVEGRLEKHGFQKINWLWASWSEGAEWRLPSRSGSWCLLTSWSIDWFHIWFFTLRIELLLHQYAVLFLLSNVGLVNILVPLKCLLFLHNHMTELLFFFILLNKSDPFCGCYQRCGWWCSQRWGHDCWTK